jgi:hypothetical protein
MSEKDASRTDTAGAGSKHEGLNMSLSEDVVLVAEEFWKSDDSDA